MVLDILGWCDMKMLKINRILDRLNQMLDNAISGKTIEESFDEEKISAIESKLHKFLMANGSHKAKLKEEKIKIDELISDISHQTKTPISNIMLYSELLSECKDDNDRARYNSLLRSQAQKLNFLISSLIKTSRLENGTISPTPKRESINMLFENIEHNYPNICIKKTDISCLYDFKWTLEAIENIVDNAFKYGGTKIEISATAYQIYCKIDIKDDGIGIDEEEFPKIFTRFYRSDNSNSNDGVGIGLYLAREIVSKQSGYIKVSSKRNIGSVFSIFLPME